MNMADDTEVKKCSTCKQYKRKNFYYSGKHECKKCKSDRSIKYYQENKNKHVNYNSLVCRQPEIILKFIRNIFIPHNKNECWIWLLSKARKGYGQFYIGAKALRAHRISYLIFKGDIDEGLFVCHTCDNPICVNPEHLWVGTSKQNAQDMISKGRLKTVFIKGHKKSRKKLCNSWRSR